MTGESQQQIVGDRGIGVQISGDGNTVTVSAGRSELVLLRKHSRKAEPTTELQLLRVDLRATTLVGRKGDLTALDAWLDSDRLISVQCITGRAGAGKTRLAIELCEHAEQAGWTAGFAQYSQFSQFVKLASEWRWDKPTLVVIDYAAALARDLRVWLEILARPEAHTGDKKLRLLLLERHAERDLGWWADLMRTVSFSDPAPDELADPPEPVPLPRLNAVEDRQALLAEAMRLAAHIAGIQPSPRSPLADANADFDRRLGDDTVYNEPLYLMMAGAEAIRTGASAALTLTRTDIAERAAGRERERLNRLALQWGLPDKLVAHLAMCVTLQGGCSAEEALQLVLEERRAMGFPETVPGTDLVNRLMEAMPTATGSNVEAVRPDLIGEAFLIQGIRENRHFPTLQIGIVERAWRRAAGKATATLIRVAQNYSQAGSGYVTPVSLLRYLIKQIDDTAALSSVADQMPEQTLALGELALLAHEKLISRLENQASRAARTRPVLAIARHNIANRLGNLGRREEALRAAEEATALCRELVAERPDEFRPGLALSLNNLAVRLSAIGRSEEAFAAVKEAAQLHRELAAHQPDAFQADLAMSLTNFANEQTNLGRYEEALSLAEEAVAIRRELSAHRPDAFRPKLAVSLDALANSLRGIGRSEEALKAAEEAATLCRELAAQQPDAFGPAFALSLNNLTVCLRAVGRHEEGLAAAEEVVEFYRKQTAHWPDAFQPNLAASLYNLVTELTNLGHYEEALSLAEEAVAIRRELVAQAPEAFRPDLASSLDALVVILTELHRREALLTIAGEAVTIQRELAAQCRDAFRPDLACSLNNFANALRAAGRHETALPIAREAAEIYRALAAQRPGIFQPDFALALSNIANALNDLGQYKEALVIVENAVAIRRELAAQRPGMFRSNLAASLNTLAHSLTGMGRSEEAMRAAKEAAQIHRELAAQGLEKFQPNLALSLHMLAHSLNNLRRPKEALAAAKEATQLYRDLANRRPEAFRPNLGMCLLVQANCLDDLGCAADALAFTVEAVSTLSPAFVEYPDAFGHCMAPMVDLYLERCQRLSRVPDMKLLGAIVPTLRRQSAQQRGSGR